MNTKKILIAEDDEVMRSALTNALTKEGHEIKAVSNGQSAIEQFQENDFDLVLADLKMPRMDGLELLKEIKAINYETIVILMTAYGSIPNAIEAIKSGAYDYITKPFLIEELLMLIQRAFELHHITEEKETEIIRFHNIVGKNKEMQKVYQLIKTIAPGESSIVIYGETGSGKELVAEAIHFMSKRRNNPFIKISCSGFPESLLESELFGHEKGAFTGALERKTGRFELANGGSLLLDDIDDLSLTAQAKLLRFMHEKKFERVGGIETIEIDVRLIAASKKDLRVEVNNGRFREDLFYRLNVIPIFLPPLRERKDDIPLLVNHFLGKYTDLVNKKITKVSDRATELLIQYNWPGNVRELENVIERAIALCRNKEIMPEDLSGMIPAQTKKTAYADKIMPTDLPVPLTRQTGELKTTDELLKETEKEHIRKVLKETGGQKIKAAGILGISRKTLWEKIREYKIK